MLIDLLSVIRWAPLLSVMLVSGCLTACANLNASPPIEAFANKLADEAIIPAVREGLTQGVEQLSIQAGAQGINPTYAVNFEGKWVVGVEGRATVGVEGVAGQIQVSSTSNEETETSPHAQDQAAGAAAVVPTTVTVRIDDVDENENKGFGRLADGTLVVILGAADKLGQTVTAEVTAAAGSRSESLIIAALPDDG